MNVRALLLHVVLAVLWLGLSQPIARAQRRANGAPICVAPSNQLTPASIADGAGGVLVTWYDYRDGNADIYAQHVLPSGAVDDAWPASGLALCMAPGGQLSPTIVGDGAGGAIVSWHDIRGPSADIYAQRVQAWGAVDPSWPANGRALCTASDDQIYPAGTTDGAGGAIVTWRDHRGGPDTDIYAQHVLATGQVDPAWPANGRALCTADGNQSVPTIASDGSGGAFVAWSDLRGGIHSDIYVQHVLASGGVDPAWPVDGRAICTALGNQSGPTIVADGTGGAILTWFDYRSALDADIYAQHILASGVADPEWPVDGQALCTSIGEQYSPVLVSDGTNGALVAWYDYRSGEEPDIYAHHILASGIADPGWPVDGRALCAAGGEQSSPSITEDGVGGAMVAWFDYRDDPASDIYAQHVLAAGAVDPTWPMNGHALCTVAGFQFSPAVAPDGAGGVIVSWTDFRGGVYSDIYAQRVDAGGVVAEVRVASIPRVDLHPIRPNPVVSEATILFDLPAPGRVAVEVLDLAGRRVCTVLSSQVLPGGPHRLAWNGRDDTGSRRGSGVYWVRVHTPGGSFTRKISLLN